MAFSSMIKDIRTWSSPIATQPQVQPSDSEKKPHLYGLRGILAVSGVFTIFVQTFIPALVWEDDSQAEYKNILRILFSPTIWDEGLITSFFFVLSGYAISLRFLNSPTGPDFAGSVIRRVFRMAFFISVSCGITYGIFGGIGTVYIEQFTQSLPNEHITAPEVPGNALIALNSIYNIFWDVRNYYSQAANAFWPTHTLWNISLIFNQSWTTYFIMVILPFTRPGWHTGAIALFAFGSWWACSWGWYSAAAILLADYSKNPQLRQRLDEGLPISKKREWTVPYKFVGGLMVAVGFALKFVWAALPQYHNKELILRPHLHLAEKTNVSEFAAADPYARLDNFSVIFGILLLAETSKIFNACLSCKPLVAIGKRSLSIFVSQSIVFWTAGIKLYVHLHDQRGVSSPTAKFAVFVVSILTTGVGAEIVYRSMDLPSQWSAKKMFTWLTRT